MILVDEECQVPAVIFDGMMAELVSADGDRCWGDVFGFDWDVQFAEAAQMPEPWQWEWRTPLRSMMASLSGRSDVTAWTLEAARELDSLLEDSSAEQRLLSALGEDVMDQLPAAAPPAVSADGVQGSSIS